MSSANSAAVNAVLLTIFASLILLAVGETFVIISGGIDLSVGATTGFSGVVPALAMRDLINAHNGEALVLILATLICAGIGAGIGLINAPLINWPRLLPFVATLHPAAASSAAARPACRPPRPTLLPETSPAASKAAR